jgi:hypothetical protein
MKSPKQPGARNLKVIRDDGNTTLSQPISTFTPDEQSHLLELADVALQSGKPAADWKAGSRTYLEHERLKQELREAVEGLKQHRDEVA